MLDLLRLLEQMVSPGPPRLLHCPGDPHEGVREQFHAKFMINSTIPAVSRFVQAKVNFHVFRTFLGTSSLENYHEFEDSKYKTLAT